MNADLLELLRVNRAAEIAAIKDEHERTVAQTAADHGLTVADFRQRGRRAPVRVAAAKADACRRLHALGKLSSVEIAKLVGYRDHTSVLHWISVGGRGKDRFRRAA